MTLTFRRISRSFVSNFRRLVCGSRIFSRRHCTDRSGPLRGIPVTPLQDLCNFLTEIHALKINLYLHSQGLGTSTPTGKAMMMTLSGPKPNVHRPRRGSLTVFPGGYAPRRPERRIQVRSLKCTGRNSLHRFETGSMAVGHGL